MKSQLRFLLLNTFFPPYSFGGDAIYVWRLANALAGDGHLVDVLHCADSWEMLARGVSAAPPLSSHPNVTIYPLRSRPRALASLATHQTGFPLGRRAQIAAAIDGKHYDVVHFNNISMFGPGILNVSTSNPPPVKLYTVLEYWLVCARHTLWKFDRRPCESRQCLQCVIQGGRPPQLWRSTDLIARTTGRVDRFLAPSRAVAILHAEHGFRRPMDVLPLFTEVPTDAPIDAPARPFERPYFLFAGRLEPIKGAEVLLQAWKRVGDADLVIAGEGSRADRLRSASAGDRRIHFVGQVSQPDLGAYYRHAIATVVPSLFEEPFGLTAIESMAHRTPIIAHRVGGLREIVEESCGGIMYTGTDQLADAMRKLRDDSNLRRAMGERGYQACLANWSRPAHLRRYYDIIEEVAAARRAGSNREHGFAG